MVDSARELCGSVNVGRKNPKCEHWNDEVNSAVRKEEAARKDVIGAHDEIGK